MKGQHGSATPGRRTILVTGGTGTLGRELVARFAGADGATVVVLTRGTRPAGAPSSASAVTSVRGDLEQGRSLGLSADDVSRLRAAVTDIVHCAAETTFNRPLDEARRANVAGTRAILDFARTCDRLERLACYSTVYVAGRATGCFGEADVGGAAGFVNSYEQSKAEMEHVVREAMAELPIALYRLSTIIGDSRTGAVTGHNAVHHALRLLYQGLAPMVPGHASTLVDLIPVDFAADAAHALFEHAFTPGATYHLCAGAAGSAPLGTLLDATMAAFERHRPAWRKRSIARPALVELDTYELFVRSVEEAGNQVLLQATRAVQAFAYQLAYPKVFDNRTADAVLAPRGIHAPSVLDYYERVIRWCIETNWGAPT
jgi:nucleoside-diphosphate-sugar epimerase